MDMISLVASCEVFCEEAERSDDKINAVNIVIIFVAHVCFVAANRFETGVEVSGGTTIFFII